MIIKNEAQAERLTSNLLDIGIALYGGGDVVHLLSLCKNRETLGSTIYKIYDGLHKAAVKAQGGKTTTQRETQEKLDNVISLLLDHQAKAGAKYGG
jgi:hypothetical protein